MSIVSAKVRINIKILLLIIAYAINFIHDIYPHSHSEDNHHSDDIFLFQFSDLFLHNHEDDNTDDGENEKHPFPHTHLLQGHTLVQATTSTTINLHFQIYYIISKIIKTQIDIDFTNENCLTNQLIFYDSFSHTLFMLRAPPFYFKS